MIWRIQAFATMKYFLKIVEKEQRASCSLWHEDVVKWFLCWHIYQPHKLQMHACPLSRPKKESKDLSSCISTIKRQWVVSCLPTYFFATDTWGNFSPLFFTCFGWRRGSSKSRQWHGIHSSNVVFLTLFYNRSLRLQKYFNPIRRHILM